MRRLATRALVILGAASVGSWLATRSPSVRRDVRRRVLATWPERELIAELDRRYGRGATFVNRTTVVGPFWNAEARR